MKGEVLSIETVERIAALEKENIDYKSRNEKAKEYIKHELYEHILNNDEETWNDEFYTDGKLNYKKLLIKLLEDLENILKGGNDDEII